MPRTADPSPLRRLPERWPPVPQPRPGLYPGISISVAHRYPRRQPDWSSGLPGVRCGGVRCPAVAVEDLILGEDHAFPGAVAAPGAVFRAGELAEQRRPAVAAD